MEKITLKVDGMSCEHCVKAVAKSVTALDGIGGVAVKLKDGTVTVKYDPKKIMPDKIKHEIEEQGYTVRND